MANGSLDLAGARILVTNDDGIHAPGLSALESIARELTDDVWVVAPESEQSATSHSLTLRRPLRSRRLSDKRYSIDGTPTDCVLVAMKKLLKDRPADLVLSGINHGANLGEDVTYSGTVAAAMEAALLGSRAIAFSQVRSKDEKISWDVPARFGPDIVRRLSSMTWSSELLVNVNFPAVSPDAVNGVRICRQGRRDLGTDLVDGVDPSGRPYVWVGQFLSHSSSDENADLTAIEEGAISVTPLHLDLTHTQSMQTLTDLFA
ncbi:5'/3'-nucleotidase SurE [Pelagibius sp. Alg239-R121]|uniref:5'/3'-nucleotidase SurE n=1 Tax=Pelagibius sp. Alg239-R121 TaxID=2993448 RepID=UPI0024A775C8|nr:5'/3'-nucleotidase SurE [Pelagibius sp. Alg239-R121]